MIIKRGQVDIDEYKECFLGDLILNNYDESKLLIFLGAEEINSGKWKLKMGLSKRCENDLKDSKLHIVNTDCLSNYSFNICIEVRIGEKIRLNEDLGSNILTEEEVGILRSKIEEKYKFYKASCMTIREIEKDRILFDVQYI